MGQDNHKTWIINEEDSIKFDAMPVYNLGFSELLSLSQGGKENAINAGSWKPFGSDSGVTTYPLGATSGDSQPYNYGIYYGTTSSPCKPVGDYEFYGGNSAGIPSTNGTPSAEDQRLIFSIMEWSDGNVILKRLHRGLVAKEVHLLCEKCEEESYYIDPDPPLVGSTDDPKIKAFCTQHRHEEPKPKPTVTQRLFIKTGRRFRES